MNNTAQNKKKIVKEIYALTLLKIKKIKNDQDKKIDKILKKIDKSQIDKIRNSINNLK